MSASTINSYIQFCFTRGMTVNEIEAAFDTIGIHFPLEGTSPCGQAFTFPTAWEIPHEDVRCECGSPTCWLVKWRDDEDGA